ncbi:MAG: MiaB/RimO family radical SAM methylthiotransferase [candidate division SR1 bacterium]|nr:MiaB/RimO family radical SAM methylthiotransferase [candidate division SR1 bacterium]
MKFHILIFGCQMNYADSARIKAVLLHCGFSYTENINEADIVIFDTCSIKQKAEDKVTGKLKLLKKTQKIWITGCMIQHNIRNGKLKVDKGKGIMKIGNFGGSIKSKQPTILGFSTEEINHLKSSEKSSEILGVNNAFNPMFHNILQKQKNLELMRRIDDTGFLPLMLQKLGYKITYDEGLINEYEKILPEQNTSMNTTHSKTAYIPISTGCNQFCSYCIVPYARGLEKNFPVEHIVEEAKKHIQRGAEEIVLIGQIVNKHPDFVSLLQKILKLKGLRRLRYTSPYPTFYSKDLLHLHATQEKLCPHIHIPFQSGSDKILKAMHRGYTAKQAWKFIDDIQALPRKISITTDIIVGFPGETEKDFNDTLKLVRHGKFDMIYIGIYSPRPGTYADKHMPDTIPYATKHARRNKLNELLKKISLANNKKEIGSTHTVLINEQGTDFLSGYTEHMKQVLVKGKAKAGDFVQVKMSKGVPFKLYGEII